MNGDKKIGVSIMKIEEKLDSGPVLISKRIRIRSKYATHGEIEKKLSIMGANLLIRKFKNYKRVKQKFIESKSF